MYICGQKNCMIQQNTLFDCNYHSNCIDLVYSATAFHWIEESIGYTKIFDMLRSRELQICFGIVIMVQEKMIFFIKRFSLYIIDTDLQIKISLKMMKRNTIGDRDKIIWYFKCISQNGFILSRKALIFQYLQFDYYNDLLQLICKTSHNRVLETFIRILDKSL